MALGRAVLQLYVYQGESSDFTPTDLIYTIDKNTIGADNKITFEIGELIRDYLDITFNDDYASHTRWVRAVVTYYQQTGEQFTSNGTDTFTYIATDGYGYFEDGINPELSRHALITANNIYLPEGTAGKLPIFAEGVGKVTIDSTDTQITDDGNTNQKIQYITIPADTSTIKVYGTDDTTLEKTITVHNICEPKFTTYKVVFMNRFGAFQDLYFFKKTTEQMTVTDETYKRNIVNPVDVTYSINKTQKQRYNVNATTRLTMNTGFIHDDMNSTIEELFLTENAWIIYEGNCLPINPVSKSMQYKTSLNDKLTDYTIDFEFGFDKINNIR